MENLKGLHFTSADRQILRDQLVVAVEETPQEEIDSNPGAADLLNTILNLIDDCTALEAALIHVHTRLDEAQEAISDAVQGDLENGVAWLNDAAAEEFNTKYPNISKALGMVVEIGVLDEVRDPEGEQT